MGVSSRYWPNLFSNNKVTVILYSPDCRQSTQIQLPKNSFLCASSVNCNLLLWLYSLGLETKGCIHIPLAIRYSLCCGQILPLDFPVGVKVAIQFQIIAASYSTHQCVGLAQLLSKSFAKTLKTSPFYSDINTGFLDSLKYYFQHFLCIWGNRLLKSVTVIL